MIPDLE